LFAQGGITERRLLETRAEHGGATANRLAAESNLNIMGVSAGTVQRLIDNGEPLAALPVSVHRWTVCSPSSGWYPVVASKWAHRYSK
jgi:hypothetical protein